MPAVVTTMKVLGQGGAGCVYLFRIDGKECALKMFDKDDIFRTEHRAYKIISAAPTLQGRVCNFLGVFTPYPNKPSIVALGVARLRGPDLRAHLLALAAPEDREPLRRELHETMDRLHRDVGVAHGDIRTENVIMEKGHPVLIDFSLAKFKCDVSSKRWEDFTREDHQMVDWLFSWADSEHATRDAAALLHGPTTPDQQHLARLLNAIEHPADSALLLRIHDMFPTPTPTLALALAQHFNRSSDSDHRRIALNLMIAGLDRLSDEQQQSPPPSTPQILAMHRMAVHAATRLESMCGLDTYGAGQLYRNAVAAHAGLCARDDLDFLGLRIGLARSLARRDDTREEALDMCGILLDEVEILVATDPLPKFRRMAADLMHLAWWKIAANELPGETKVLAKGMYWRAKKIVMANKSI